MADRPNPIWLRLLCAAVAAGLATLFVSGPILWLSFELYNPWYHPLPIRMPHQNTLLEGVLVNMGQHSLYVLLGLAAGPLWFVGSARRERPLFPRTILVGTAVGAIFSALLLLKIVSDLNAPWCGGIPGDCVIWWRRIFVPDFLAVIAAFLLMLVATVLFAWFDTAGTAFQRPFKSSVSSKTSAQ